MLNKKVCKKCCKITEGVDPWDKVDNRFWREGSADEPKPHVNCPLDYVDGEGYNRAFVESAPPRWCPYKFEHAVAAGSR
jgi:hypothetical protein